MTDPASHASMELPEEIERAIEALSAAAEQFGGQTWIAASDGAAVIEAHAALTAAILSRLREAEAGRDEERSRYGAWADEIKVVLAQVNGERSAALARVKRLEKALADLSEPTPAVIDAMTASISGQGALPDPDYADDMDRAWRAGLAVALTEAGRLAIKDA